MGENELSAEMKFTERFPYGLFGFSARDLPVDLENPVSVEVTLFFPEDLPADTKWYINDSFTEEMSDFSRHANFEGRKVTLTFTDGGFGDSDGTVNGVIVDPSGPAFPSSRDETSGGGGAMGPLLLLYMWIMMAVQIKNRRYGRVG